VQQRASGTLLRGVDLICILIESELLRGPEGLAVGLNRPALSGPPVKQAGLFLSCSSA